LAAIGMWCTLAQTRFAGLLKTHFICAAGPPSAHGQG
jgi:hypothetical protein